MVGWILRNFDTLSSAPGEVLGEDGRVYVFREDCLEAGTPSSFSLTQSVLFSPIRKENSFLAEHLSKTEDQSPEDLYSIREKVRGRLSEKRYLHCFRVSKIARVFAQKAGCSADKAEYTGLLHDIAKELPSVESAQIASESGADVSDIELGYHHFLHAITGAVLAQRDFGITDPEILSGIRYHNGRPAMKTMDKILFVADHVDWIYKNGGNANPLLDTRDPDDAIYHLILQINQYYARQRLTPDALTECTMNYMLQSIGKAPAVSVVPDTPSVLSDELFDEALEIVTRRSAGLRSVTNARQLGGLMTSSGKKIRRNVLVRSARLNTMSREDAEVLRGKGVNTVIDLRSPEEVAEQPDRNVESFRYCSCPLPTVELVDFQKEIAGKFVHTGDSREKTFYLSEYLSCLSMEDMYFEILTAEDALISIRKVFSILMDPGTNGVLFHCTSGKDRTGIVAALILFALGARMEDIRSDYYASALATFSATEAMAQGLRRENYGAGIIDEIRYYNGIGRNFAEGVYARLMDDYGSVKAYLSEALLLTEKQQELLRQKYLE